jgi:hypothetical protein
VAVVADTAIKMRAATAVTMPAVRTQPSLFPRMDDTMSEGIPAKKSVKQTKRMSFNDMFTY